MTPLLAPHATLTVSPLLYRRHLVRPDVLPLLMARSGYLLTDEAMTWLVLEGDGPFLAAVNDFELDFPNQGPPPARSPGILPAPPQPRSSPCN